MLQRSTVRYLIAAYVADILLTCVALVLAREARLASPFGQALTPEGHALHWSMFVMIFLIWSVALSSLGAYAPHRIARWAEESQTVVLAVGASIVVFAGALYFSYRGLSRLLFVYFGLLDVALLLGARLALRAAFGQRATRRRAVLIAGAGQIGQRVAESLQPCRWMGIDLVGYLDDAPEKQGQTIAGLPVLGSLGEADAVIAAHGVQEVIVALPLAAHERLGALVRELGSQPVNVKVVPDYSQLVFLRTTLESLGGLFLIGLKEPVIGPVDRAIKRGFDIVGSAVGLLLLAPLLLVIALLVRVTSPGPVLYVSRRVGEGGRVFPMRKFRTMRDGADLHEEELISETEDGALVFEKRPDDPRVTPIGRILRRYSLDELPQLYNVLVGDMSLVGPRPELPSLVVHYEPWQMKRFAVPQGLTGWWQISGRASKAKHLHAEDDLYYIRNYSVLLDVKIIVRTPLAVLRGEGAF
ncbi:MAG: sugar transferase [Chloroflexi bacterium]|nr:sugar transferase [Chloroflexota bacterium]